MGYFIRNGNILINRHIGKKVLELEHFDVRLFLYWFRNKIRRSIWKSIYCYFEILKWIILKLIMGIGKEYRKFKNTWFCKLFWFTKIWI